MLNRGEILELVKNKGLVSGFIDMETQLTPNGFDLTVSNIYEFISGGELDFSNKERVLPGTKEVFPQKKNKEDKFGWWDLKKGVYKVRSNEIISLPNDLIAVSFPRSSLLRMGVFTHTGVWDAGFKGVSEFILAVDNLSGARIKQNARVVQLIFEKINETDCWYNGIYQNK
ncbi:MAG: deoxyuridine 5'-triphosphate nucleotidohydrolase [Candidatus Omnitrophica bacterium]|nr:deoxyuridine 5'-triphosphate nucleotidohydrolase [Candidatus Omnitrophota bacterium]